VRFFFLLILQIDRWIIPVVAIQYLLAFIDRANIGNARLAGLEKDLGLTGYDYNILLSIFYVSYSEFSPLPMRKIGPSAHVSATHHSRL
jgi:hypothetical protein